MHFVPTISEITESRSNGSLVDLPSEPSDLTKKDLYVSGSRWGQTHLKALQVQLIEPVSPERIFPCQFLPPSDDPGTQYDCRYARYAADHIS